MSRDSTWVNKDGLSVGYGKHSEDNEANAVYSSGNGEVTFVTEITLASLLTTATAVSYPITVQSHVIPRGSIFLRGEIQTLVAPVGAGGSLDIGTWSRGLATEVVDDIDGFVDALLIAEIANVGDVSICDGGLIADAADSNLAVAGAISNTDVVLAAEFNTVFTAGKLRVTITYRPPTGSMGRVLAA